MKYPSISRCWNCNKLILCWKFTGKSRGTIEYLTHKAKVDCK